MQVAGPQLTSARAFFQPLLSSTSPVVQKQALVQALQGLRAQENDGSVTRAEKRGVSVWNGDKASFLDLLVKEMESTPRFLQKSFGRTLKFLPSYRVKLGALQRVVQMILCEEAENAAFANVLLKCESVEELSTYRMGRKRRALSIVLGQLQNQEGIHKLEQEARARDGRSNSMSEMLERTPSLETPRYSVIWTNDKAGWEVRQYESFSVCSMSMVEGAAAQEGPAAGGGGGFNSLAAYIFGKNDRDGAPLPMKMTTPVISSGGGAAGAKKMSFVMPSAYWDANLSAAPKPVDPSVVVEAWVSPVATAGRDTAASEGSSPKPLLAVKWFGGYCSPRDVERQANLLRGLVAATGGTGATGAEFEISGDQVLFQYNDPFQPPWRRRNEVAFPVVRK